MSKGLGIYSENPRYFTIDGTPVFLTGATPTWVPLSNTKIDFLVENKALVDHRGNMTRILTFFPGGDCVPWATVEGTPDGEFNYDMTKWNEAYWERFRTFFKDCDEKKIVVCMELFDNPSIEIHPWSRHPFNPANNINLTTEDGLPEGKPEQRVQQLYDPVRFSHMKKVLEFQTAYVTKVLQEALPYSHQIIFSICNEYSYTEYKDGQVDKSHAFDVPEYWATFVKNFGKEHGKQFLVTSLPTGAVGEALDLEYTLPVLLRPYFDSTLFDAVDMMSLGTETDVWAQGWHGHIDYYTGAETVDIIRRQYSRWIVYQQITQQIKPLFNSKVLYKTLISDNPPAPEPMWCYFFLGAAGCRAHRPGAKAPNEVIEGQLDIIHNMRTFIDKVPFWTMKPFHDLVTPGCLCIANPAHTYAVFNPKGGEFALYLEEPFTYKLQWCRIDDASFADGGEIEGKIGGVKLTPAFDGPVAMIAKKIEED